MDIDIEEIRERARRELEAECFRGAVEAEKTRLRALQNLSFWQRLINKLPFTITRKP